MPIHPSNSAQARLGPISVNASDDFVFPLAPRRMPWQGDAVYVTIPIALADYGPKTPASNPPPVAWNRNAPERISLEFKLVHEKELRGSGRDDIEAEIKKLQDFRYKAQQSREPPDLVYSFGKQTDRVRIDKLTIDTTLWSSDGRRQIADCTMQLIITRPRSR